MHQSTSHPSSPSPPSSPTPAREHHTSSLGRKMKKPFLYVKDHLAPKHHDDTETTPPRAGSGRGLLKRLSLSTSHIRSPSDTSTSTSPPPSPTPPSHRRHRTTSLHSLIHHISFHPRSSSHTMAETPKSQDLTESPPETLAHRSSVESERPGSLGELSSVKSSLAEEVTPIAVQVAPSPEVSAAHEDKGPASDVTPIAPAAEVFATPVAPMDEEFAVPIAPAVEEFATLVVLEVEESVPAPAVEEPAPAPAVEEPVRASAVEEPAPAPAVEEAVPAPAVEEAVPAPAVEEAISAPAVEEPLPAPAVEEVVPAPAVEEPVPAPAVEEPVSAPAAEEVAPPPEEAPSRQDDGQVSAPVEFGESATLDILAPPAVTKPEIPEPFLIEDVESPVTESEPPTARFPPQVEPSLSASQVGAAEDISLSLQTPVGSSEALPVLVVEEKHEELAPFVPIKPVVAPPSVSDSSESEAPAIYLPQLVLPAMFLPIPNADPLTTLLMKYIPNSEQRPRRDVMGEWAQTDFHTLVMTNSWRALARMARDRLVQSDPEDIDAVLNLWSLRLSALARLRLFNQTAAETTNLFTALHGVPDPAARAHLFAHVLPFELEVLHARVKYWAGDALGYVDALGALLGACRTRARRARSDGDRQMWMERGARVGLIAASQFVEMKDYIAATRLLEPLLAQPAATPDLRSAIARIYLQAGQLDAAAAHFAAVAAAPDASDLTKEMNAVLLATARGEWDDVSAALRRIVESDPENFTAVNNLSVALLSQGKLKEATEVLEAAFQASPSTLAMAEPFLFNLSTLYELRSGVAVDKKRDLLVQVAQWSGDGLRTTCLKMPSN